MKTEDTQLKLKKKFVEKYVSKWMVDDGNNKLLWKDKAPTPNEMLDFIHSAVEEQRKEIEKEAGAAKAAEMVKKAKEAISELEAAIEKVKTSGSEVEKQRLNSVRILFDRARTNLREAENLYKNERYGAAYGQANSARVAARNALAQLLKRVEDKKNAATSTDSVKKEQKKEQQTETLDQTIKKTREAIKRTTQNIKDTKSKLPASPAGGSASGTAASGTQ